MHLRQERDRPVGEVLKAFHNWSRKICKILQHQAVANISIFEIYVQPSASYLQNLYPRDQLIQQ